MKVVIFDTTLRDGTQGEGVNVSVKDKLKIAKKLDAFGVDYIEGGWPFSNPKDTEFFQKAAVEKWQGKICSFGSTCRVGVRAEEDVNLQALVNSQAPAAAIFGKTWDYQVAKALGTTLEENLRMIHDSVAYLVSKGIEVIFDAEHFFDGYKADSEYALKCLENAQKAGASWLALCDTNGGTLPHEVFEIVQACKERFTIPLGIHAHNDCELAVANSIAAVKAGAAMVHGTFNGVGERCGNANLCSVIPNLELKMGYETSTRNNLNNLTETARYVAEVINIAVPNHQPFVGHSAFTHKGGMHASAVMKHPKTYEHITPETVGNDRRILMSELAGTSNLTHKLEEMGIKLADKEMLKNIVEQVKELEHKGYQFEGAEASLELLLYKVMGLYKEHFHLENFKVLVEKRGEEDYYSEAIIKLKIGEEIVHTAAEGNGPVNALDNALRKSLDKTYPCINEMHLSDYKVRVLEGSQATAAKVRVLIESKDANDNWSTVGVSSNIIEASWEALLDSMDYILLKKHLKELGRMGN
ncbi:citramalate synthase [Desulfitibacter alkalitolerans]|uniref:citramalate synthase n=1 Tax=Desulfitibacter alkalitolerans TaxID=264641 RepID=UPI0004884DBA|nr:citramalate synthase [Desulfitibacter alkalitolerans]